MIVNNHSNYFIIPLIKGVTIPMKLSVRTYTCPMCIVIHNRRMTYNIPLK